MSHFNKAGRERLNSRKQLIMAEAMRTSNATKLRLLLAIILRQPFSEEEIATLSSISVSITSQVLLNP